MRLDPCPRWSENVATFLGNPRIIIFAIVMAKICIDRIYNLAKIVNPNAMTSPEGGETLDIVEYYHPSSAQEIYTFLDNYGNKGRLAYQSLLMFDSGFLVARTVPLCLLLHWAFAHAPRSIRPGIWVPVASMVVDLLENATLLTLLKLYPQRHLALAQCLVYLIDAKWKLLWALVGLAFISMLVGIYYGFHSMLADSVLMDKDKTERAKTRIQVAEMLAREQSSRKAKKTQ